MALSTTNPYLDALGGPTWPRDANHTGFDGALLLSVYFDPATSAGHSTGGAWTPDEVSAYFNAIHAWTSVANIRILEVQPLPDEAIDPAVVDIWMRKETSAELGATTLGRTSLPDATGEHFSAYNVNLYWTLPAMQQGGYTLETFIHELGHGIGLGHPHDKDGGTGLFPGVDGLDASGKAFDFDGDGSLVEADGTTRDAGDISFDQGANSLNSIPNSIMSYNEATGSNPATAADRGFASTPLAFDIAALQAMYGAIKNNDGDTVYTLVDDGPGTSYRCIWDTSGTDTIQYNGSNTTTIDLRAATLRNEVGGGGFLSQVNGVKGGFTIAADYTDFDKNGNLAVLIENAVGGSGADTIRGNEIANRLEGRAGRDTLIGGGGNDTLIGGTEADTLVFGDGWGNDTVTDFEVAGDVLDLRGIAGLTSLALLNLTNTADGEKLEFAGNSIVLNGITIGQLKAGNYLFNAKVADGYVSGATVFADANNNRQFDVGEASTTTDANGTFFLTGQPGALIAFGGVDTSTGLTLKVQLSAPEHSIAITPLTTLLTAGASEANLLAALSLPSGFDLTISDPIGALRAGEAESAKVFIAGAEVMNTVSAFASAIAGLGGIEANAQHDAFATIAAAVNTGAILDLTSVATISSLFATLAQREGIEAPQVTEALASAIAASNASIDQQLATDGASDALVTNVGALGGVIQANHQPHAVNDFATATTGIGGTASADVAHGVLINDSDPDGDALTATGFTGGVHGTLVLSVDGSYSYTVTDLTGPTGSHLHDVFTYGITDGRAGVALGTLDITLNRAPNAADNSNGVPKAGTISSNVLANDADPDGDVVQITSVVGGSFGHSIVGTYGACTLNADGSYTYVANQGSLPSQIVAQDVFQYTVSDGHGGTDTANLYIVVFNPGVSYQAGINTILTGGNGPDVLDGSAGNCQLFGGNGPDVLIGGRGDTLTGGNGPDTYLFRPEFGANTITDFDINNDAIQLDKSIFTSVADMLNNHTTNTAVGVVITDANGDTITLIGVRVAELQAHTSDFYLV